MILRYLSLVWAVAAPAVANHLWQSTLFAGAVAVVILILQKNHARARYWLWLAASLKFLVPFSLLVDLGRLFAVPGVHGGKQALVYIAMVPVGQPFIQPAMSQNASAAPMPATTSLMHLLPAFFVAVWLCGFVAVLCMWGVRWRRISRALGEARPLGDGREVRMFRQLERAAGIRKPVAVFLSRSSQEPGIFGLIRPVLILPEGISDRLDDAHLNAILAHEACHLRHRDNLAAAAHMVVESLFWFYPLVWWLGARLVAERERGCDEEVLEWGSEQHVYAESILKVCEFCVESALDCVSGVAGSDLKKRIDRIMTQTARRNLDMRRKVLLGVAGFAALAVPVGFGVVYGSPMRVRPAQIADAPLPSFEVASVRRSRPGENSRRSVTADGLSMRNLPPEELIEIAYGHDFGDFGFRPLRGDWLLGVPSWAGNWLGPAGLRYEGYDVNAKVDDSLARKFGKDSNGHLFWNGRCSYRHEMMLMFQSLLADRFKLKVRHETREVPIYALVAAQDGPKFLHTTFTLPPPRCPAGMRCLQAYTSMARLANELSGFLDRPVRDETGLQGGYYIKLEWPQKPSLDGTHIAPAIASTAFMFSALQEQLGLKLKPTQGPVDFLVIDRIERPSEN